MLHFILRPWREEDLPSLVKYADNPDIAKFMTDGFPHPYTEECGKKFIRVVSADDPVKVFAIEINGEAAGSVGIFQQQDVHRMNAEIGYWLAEIYWGNGVMSRVLTQMTEYGFTTFGINRIFARPFGSNRKSARVLEKAGFRLEAIFKGALIKNGVFEDEMIYSIRKNNTL
jgi:RimJ/RimL family protein N-acetyltransferase